MVQLEHLQGFAKYKSPDYLIHSKLSLTFNVFYTELKTKIAK